MIKIGLTGSIGMGKSTIANIFRTVEHIPVFDSDHAVADLIGPNGAAVAQVTDYFPDCWDQKNHMIDKSKLRDIIFNDDDERILLENILHPYVWQAQDKFTDDMRRMGAKIAVFDIPLLFETGAQDRFDYIIVASAPAFIQYQRVMRRPGMDDDMFFRILSRQIPDKDKCDMADFIIPTGLGLAHSTQCVKQICYDLKHDISQHSISIRHSHLRKYSHA